MTYPDPSASHKEIVCTAGVTESGEWIRLYPLDCAQESKCQRAIGSHGLDLLLISPADSHLKQRFQHRRQVDI
jgi:hypothetical protein